MKTYFGFFVLLVLAACSSPKFYAYHLANLPGAEQGTIYIETTGLGNSEDVAYNNAASEAFNAVLFKGIPGSIQPKPMVDDESAARRDHKQIIDCFHTFDCYSKFVSGSEKIGTPEKVKGGTSVNLHIKINLNLLRSYLEENNVIRKFGL